ncbi:MAG: aspartate aminotransferase family protein [Thermoplasmata archaeon]|jgi:taurine--2-oxoglutarate transaminase
MEKKVYENNDFSEITTSLTYGTWRKQMGWKPLLITRAYDCYFEDSRGRKYLDFSSQLMCSNLGHANKRIIEAVNEQMKMVEYIQPSFATEIRAKVAMELKSILPSNLVKYFFGSSGTDANEAAIKIIRLFKKKEGKVKIISNYNSYHGSTMGSISLTGDFRRIAVDNVYSSAHIIHGPPPYCYRCPFKLKYPDCNLACADYLEYIIKNEGNVGGIFLEPVTGTNGVIIPPDGYLRRVREIASENGVVFVADEVMSGWGRTGEWFAVDNWGIRPDILTTAKGITGAHIPLSLVATNNEISEFFQDNYFAHGMTYEAHPVPLAAAYAAIREYKERNLIENSRELGKVLKKRLEEIKESHISVGDVRSIGLFGAVEIVKDRDKKTPFNSYQDKIYGNILMTDKVAKNAMENGVYISAWINHFIIAPPLIISRDELLHGLDIIDESLKISDMEVKK